MGGWEAPCWERLRRAVREAAAQSESPDSAEAALRHIYDLLYLDIGPTGDFYNPDKVCYVVRCSYVGSLFLFSCRKP